MPRKTDKTTLRAVYGRNEDKYLELVRRLPLRPIRSDAELDAAVAVIDGLTDRDLSPPERDYLDVLGDLVEAYENDTVLIGHPGDAALLTLLIADRGVTQAQVAKDTGIAESTISEVLAGKRKLNRSQIAKLARYFRVEPGAFVFAE
jgi:HTH-type transcriptional regulator/antitoxin HigA